VLPRSKNLGIFLLLTLLVVAMISPLAAHQYFPLHDDYYSHLNNIAQAKIALLQGAGWLRVMPEAMHGWFYPEFQFYSPLVYTLAGYIDLLVHNPFAAFKCTLGLTLILGSWYCYKWYVVLFEHEVAALLGVILYLSSPYLLINMNVRGDLTEGMAQGIVPIVLYYTYRLFVEKAWGLKKLYFFLLSVLALYILLTVHLITFVYSSIFGFLWFFGVGLQCGHLKNFKWLVLAFVSALLLAFQYIFPIVTYQVFLYMNAQQLPSPFMTNYFTPLATLLAPKGLSSGAATANPLDFGLGLVILLSAIYWIYRLYVDDLKFMLSKQQCSLLQVTLLIFCLAIFVVWSPVNFWELLPHELYIVQFPFRVLTQLMWLGGILFVAAVIDLFGDCLQAKWVVIGSFLIILSGSGWLFSDYQNTPETGAYNVKDSRVFSLYAVADYLISTQHIYLSPTYALTTNPALLNVFKTQLHCQHQALVAVCDFNSGPQGQYVQLPILYYPVLLNITVNGVQQAYYPSVTHAFGRDVLVAAVYLPAGHVLVRGQFVGLEFANKISYYTWLVYLLSVCYFLYRRGPYAVYKN
jgi:hypothetical protein